MTIRRLFISFFAVAAAVAVAIGQTSVEISLPRNARVGSRFTITVTVNNPDGNVSAPKLPELSGCTFIGGPGTSTSTSVSIINGRMQRSETQSYTYSFQGDKEGEVSVPSIAVSVNGKTYSTQPGRFVIGAGSPQQGGASAGNQPSRRPGANSGNFEVGPNELYMAVGISANNVYEQQAVEAVIKLYSTNMQVEGLATSSLPTFDGCLIESLGMPQTIEWKPETVGGRQLYSAVVYRALLYPQRAGSIELKGGEYTAQAYRQTYVQDIFGYRPMMESKEVKLKPRSTTLTVKALPEPRPAGFSGAVGKFDISARLVGNKFKTNEASTIIYTIEGTGNIKFLSAPKIDFPSEFEVYEPSVDNTARVSGRNMTGTQTVEYTQLASSASEHTILSISILRQRRMKQCVARAMTSTLKKAPTSARQLRVANRTFRPRTQTYTIFASEPTAPAMKAASWPAAHSTGLSIRSCWSWCLPWLSYITVRVRPIPKAGG